MLLVCAWTCLHLLTEYLSVLTQNVLKEQVNKQICFSVPLHLTIDHYSVKKQLTKSGLVYSVKKTNPTSSRDISVGDW